MGNEERYDLSILTLNFEQYKVDHRGEKPGLCERLSEKNKSKMLLRQQN